jgi:hypothetical protein
MTLWLGVIFLFSKPAYAAPPIDPDAEPAAGAPQAVFNFDKDIPNQLPKGFSLPNLTRVSTACWSVQGKSRPVSRPHVLVQNGQAGPGNPFSLILVKDLFLEDGDITVKFKVTENPGSESLGIVYRYQNPELYHVAVIDTKDIGCSLYRVKKDKLKQLDNKGAIVSPYTWHTLRLLFRKSLYTLYLDGQLVMGGKDKTDLRPGQVGLWTTDGTTAEFDDLVIAP